MLTAGHKQLCHRCLHSPSREPEGLFHDLDFPTDKDSLRWDWDNEMPQVSWKRPHEISKEPQIFVDGTCRGDVTQGGIGDCWFLSACAAVAERPDLIHKVIPEGQVLYGDGYTGLVSFRFWRMGEWVTINIDDRLPVDENDDLVYASCKGRVEFWLPLMEKAFAKFHGDYKCLKGGFLSESLTSLTGFISEGSRTTEWETDDLFELLRLQFNQGSLITCSRGGQDTKGLVSNHSYSVTEVRSLRSETDGLVTLVRVRNPWGHYEWSGAWGDGDPRWKKLDPTIRKQLDYSKSDDGEFWMTVAHFSEFFDDIAIATKIPDFSSEYVDRVDYLLLVRNAWKKGVNAGGCRNNLKKFATNPQYLLTVKETDDGEICEFLEDTNKDEEFCEDIDTCSVVVELVQEHNRKKYQYLDNIALGVYKTREPHSRLTAIDLRKSLELQGSSVHTAVSSVVGRFNLEPGNYVIIPSTFEPDQNREFLLRVYCRKPVQVKELS